MKQKAVRSYAAMRLGLIDRLLEMWHLYKFQSRDLSEQVKSVLKGLQDVEKDVREKTGLEVRNLKILDVGAGQDLRNATYFAVHNDVVGIDLDEIIQGLDLRGYYRMWRKNGAVRVMKTAGRKALGLDRKFHKGLMKHLGGQRFKPPKFVQGDATDMPFPAHSFDMVFSTSVFEHLADPAAVLDETVRVLKPGGVAHINAHLYTSDSGCHDPRILCGQRDMIPRWAHLRPAYASMVRPNSYLNRIRLKEWNELFLSKLPGVRLDHYKASADTELARELATIRSRGELSEYTDEELLTVVIVAVWSKP